MRVVDDVDEAMHAWMNHARTPLERGFQKGGTDGRSWPAFAHLSQIIRFSRKTTTTPTTTTTTRLLVPDPAKPLRDPETRLQHPGTPPTPPVRTSPIHSAKPEDFRADPRASLKRPKQSLLARLRKKIAAAFKCHSNCASD